MAATTSNYSTNTSSQSYTEYRWFGGIVISETAGGAAIVNVRNGGASENIAFTFNVPASNTGGSVLPNPVRIPAGMYVEVNSGSVRYTLIHE